MRRPIGLVASGAIGLVLLAWFGHGFANYDTAYALLWGDDLAHGRLPDYDVTLAPTPHPLQIALAMLLAPLGEDAETAAVVVAYLALGTVGWLVFRLGHHAFGTMAGIAAAVLVLTREPVLSYGLRAYVDIPYVALVLGAVLVAVRRPRADVPVLGLLALAGLLRPEAWLLAAGWLAWRWRSLGDAQRVRLVALTAAAPLIWALSDLLITGDLLHSLTGTRENVATLDRKTGLDDLPLTAPRRLGEILREPGLLAAAAGLVYAWRRHRAAAQPLLAALVVALAAFAVLAAAGLPILTRYLLLPAALLAVFAGAALLWRPLAVVVLVAFAAFTPAQADRLGDLRGAIERQERYADDLHALARSGAIGRGCGPVAIPNHRLRPLLALWLERDVREIVAAQEARPSRGWFVAPASRRVEREFILDRRDRRRLTAPPPAGFEPVARNRSWVVYARCRP